MPAKKEMSSVPPTWQKEIKPQEHRIVGLKTDLPPAVSEEGVFSEFVSNCHVTGSHVLEIGGQVEPALVRNHGIGSWISIDPLSDSGNFCSNYRVVAEDFFAANLESNNFDFVFACNSVHHISPLDQFFCEVHRVLRPGGLAYLHFGPIWSAPDGHHLDIKYNGVVYCFSGIAIIPHWFHLLYSKIELKEILRPHFSTDFVDHVVSNVYESPWLNRNFFEDYLELAQNAGLSIMKLDTNNLVDYDYFPPDYDQPTVTNSIVWQKLHNKYAPKKNFWTRDLLMVLLKT